MKSKIFSINALTNMHVGSGEVNYGLIDNLIQRDPILELPNINASSLKGALREYCTILAKEKRLNFSIEAVFGSDPKDQERRLPGSVRFFEAELVSLPVRSDKVPYMMATSKSRLLHIMNMIETFEPQNGSAIKVELQKVLKVLIDLTDESVVSFNRNLGGAVVGDLGAEVKVVYKNVDDKLDALSTVLGENLIILKDEDLKLLCSDDYLPVISRNNLEDRQSKNLWYEQVLPKYSRLIFALTGEDKQFDDFCAEMNDSLVQIGANATIGYGLCKLSYICVNQNK